MSTLTFTALIALSSVGAGLIGALTGLGGGIILVPLLTLGFGVNVRYAAGASLVSVIATSSGAAASYVRDGFTNLRLGMLLEVATTLGAADFFSTPRRNNLTTPRCMSVSWANGPCAVAMRSRACLNAV